MSHESSLRRYDFGFLDVDGKEQWAHAAETITETVQAFGELTLVGGAALRLQMLLRGMKAIGPGSGDVDFCVDKQRFIQISALFKESKIYQTFIESGLVTFQQISKTNDIFREINENKSLFLINQSTGQRVDIYQFHSYHPHNVEHIQIAPLDMPISVLCVEELYRVRLLSVRRELRLNQHNPLSINYLRVLRQLTNNEKMKFFWQTNGRKGSWEDLENEVMMLISEHHF